MYFRRRCYYLVTIEGRWINLGRDYAKAMAEFGRLTATDKPLAYFGDSLDRYLREISPGKAPRTYQDELAAAKHLRAFFGRMRHQDIEKQHSYVYQDERSQKAKVRPNRELALASQVWEKAIKWGAAKGENPFLVDRLPETGRTRDLGYTELEAFINYCTAHKSKAAKRVGYYALFKFMTALRQRDILSLRLDQLFDDGAHVEPTKTRKSTGKRLIIKWTKKLHEVVSAIVGLNDKVTGLYLFCNRRGQPYTAHGWSANWRRWRDRAIDEALDKDGRPLISANFHDSDIRAAAAADLDSIDEAAKLLAHASPQTTKRHYRRRPEKVTPIR